MSTYKEQSQNILNSYKIDLSKFKVVRKLQSGAFASIYEVRDKQTNVVYAAKISKHLDEEENEQSKKMINREIRIMMLFQHPTIIKFYGYSLTDFSGNRHVTILMDVAPKGSLFNVLLKARDGLVDNGYNNTARQIILTGIARGMMFLHQHNVIHRDLKPGNILLDENFHPLITDFGLSKIFDTGTEMVQSRFVGTSYYMAPEVIMSQRYNGKADVYSYGIIMYEVITETIAYPDLENGNLSVYEFSQKVACQNYRPQFTIPIKKSFRQLIERCWANDPNDRPTFEEIFNNLAFNHENSIYESFDEIKNAIENQNYYEDDESENKYYLEDIEIDDFLCYIDDIVQSDIKEDKSQSRADLNNLKKEAHEMTKEVNSFPKKIESISEQISKLQQLFENFDEQTNVSEKVKLDIDECAKEIQYLNNLK